MTDHREKDPLEALRQIDPIRDDQLSAASLARVRARVSEDIMTTTSTSAPPRSLLPVLTGSAFAVGAIALLLSLSFGRGQAGPGVVPGDPLGPGNAACVEPYRLATLAHRDFAFDGVVEAIDGESVTFRVNSAFSGGLGDRITLTATGMTGTAITSADGPTLTVGDRYLVAGDDTFAWACGYTQPYDATTAAAWASAFGG